MEKVQASIRVMELSQIVIDLKAEKKKYLAEINDQIKNAEAEIKNLCVEGNK